jgi:D-serine deaminase-like pyridoxal phosphate-dependent protein
VIDNAAVAALDDRVLDRNTRGSPRRRGSTVRDFLRTAPSLDQLSTPVLTVDRGAMESNVAVMADWAVGGRTAGPARKTTMAPQVWAKQLNAGAWGITLATPWQVQVARSFGVGRIMLANSIVDPSALAWLAAELDRDPSFEFFSWVDSVQTVELMDHLLGARPGERPVHVLVELGAPHGRTGARTLESARAIAAAVHHSARLTLAGVGGYEGALSHDREPAGLDTVREYLDQLGLLHRQLAGDGRYGTAALITAGGSAYPDLVVEQLAHLADERGEHGVPTSVVLRSGAYVIHDDGFYAGISPLIPGRASARCGRRCTGGHAPFLDPRRNWRCSTRASATRHSTTVSPYRYAATQPTAESPLHCVVPASMRSTTSTRFYDCPRAMPLTSRSAPSCGWACRIRARHSTSGG